MVSAQGLLEIPMVILSLVMIVVFVIEVSAHVSPGVARVLDLIQWAIWVAFVIEFAVKVALAPDNTQFIKSNWLMVIAIILPAFRIFRIARAAQALRSIGALRVITLGNRTISKLEILFARRRLQYVMAVVAAMSVLSGAGIYYLEKGAPGATIRTLGDGLWFASGIVTTVGTELYPVTAEGRVLSLIGMVFGVSVFGYLAGSLASLFVDIDRADKEEDESVDESQVEALTQEIESLQQRIAELTARFGER